MGANTPAQGPHTVKATCGRGQGACPGGSQLRSGSRPHHRVPATLCHGPDEATAWWLHRRTGEPCQLPCQASSLLAQSPERFLESVQVTPGYGVTQKGQGTFWNSICCVHVSEADSPEPVGVAGCKPPRSSPSPWPSVDTSPLPATIHPGGHLPQLAWHPGDAVPASQG